jgi:AcrR family transcriptional regulator
MADQAVPGDVPRSSGRTHRRARNSVSREEVLAAALAIVDAKGLEALSMRHLAARLDTGPMRAYRHFETKDELVEGLAEEQARRIRELDLGDVTEPKDILLELARRTRALLLEHPNLAPEVIARPLSKATAVEDLRFATWLLVAAGFDGDQVPQVSAGITTYSLGFVLYELGQRRLHVTRRDEMIAAYEEMATQVEGETLMEQQVAGIRAAVAGDWADRQFESGLQAIADGYWAQRARQGTEAD